MEKTSDKVSDKADLTAVPIWRCVDKECKVWVREEMAASDTPECPMCKGKMIRGIKHLPKLIHKHKSAPRNKA
ncbi:cold-inducible protein YdjO-related protein [Cohnella endophytica]|uniref:cold-inducible protein YdjO-related protein n=1 Tax=Cohnella endophytica TaxID=2419778 RepID=UPI001F298145|nr:cold-inducible protein YdjO-related protein [Cohnella endophytica]